MSENWYINAENVTYGYSKSEFSIKPMDLKLKQQDITFLLGENGSGKTTLGKLLTGIFKPSSGVVFIDGKRTTDLTLGQIGKKIGYLWQKPELQLFAPTVREELTFAESLRKKGEMVEEKANELLAYFELSHLASRSTSFLSRGEKQRLALAAVVSNGASYLFLDEPTTGLDEKRKNILIQLLTRLNQHEKIGMTLISHDEDFISALASRVLIMKEGEIIDDKEI